MDIDLLSKMVKELILDNDRVELPGLGSFVAEVVPASFSDKGYTINPPYRKLYFRSSPEDGTLLVDFYARTNGVEIAMARKILTDFLAELKSVLHVRKAVAFPGLGRLRATKENNLFFVADEDLDIYPEGFALEPLSLKTHQETREEVSSAVESLAVILEQKPETHGLTTEEPQPETTVAELLPEAPAEDQQPEAPAVEQTPETPAAEPVSDDVPAKARKERIPLWKRIMKTLLWLAVAAILCLVVYAVVARLCPELADRILYTPEELEILNKLK